MNNLVSIAIPAYKATYLENAIRSALNQSYSNIELIIVNDASPEPMHNIVKQFSDTRMRYYENESNLGFADPSQNWNKCLSYARGEYFSLLCDDDQYAPYFIEEMLALKKRYPKVSVFRSRVEVIDGKDNVLDWYPASPEYESCYDYMWQILSSLRKQTISEFMYETEHIKQLNGFVSLPRGWGSDHLSVFQFSRENGIASTNRILVAFRKSDENISSNYTKDVFDKLKAHLLYRDQVDVFLEQVKDTLLSNKISKAKEIFFKQEVIFLLTKTPLRHFYWLYRYKSIPKIFFLKAIELKIINRLAKCKVLN